ncbi:MAG TPA: polysaccharide deacetylase family protein [Caulobacterales bacterium]|nr:polysaccharide deacetylase family protein [Caulobacterales bacterium]
MKAALKSIVRATGVKRRDVAAVRMCCERHFLASFGRPRRRYVGRILCYHTIGQPDWGVNDVSPAQFRRQIETALNAGFRFVKASDIARTGGGPKDLAITFDDGLKSVITHAAPILKDYNLPWSFFPVTEWSDMKTPWCRDIVLTWSDMEQLLAQGAELGSHSATHPDFAQIDEQQVVDELGESRKTIEQRLGFAPTSFAIPLGQSMNWTETADKAARAVGYDVIYAQAEETRAPGTVARTFVTKFDGERIFKALLAGKYDSWEEWV